MTLTNTAIEALLPGQEMKDDKVPGLSVRANASGKSFLLYYRVKAGPNAGKPRRPKIGDWGILSLAQARDISRAMLGQVAAGQDLAAERDRAKGQPSMADLWERCTREVWHQGKAWDRNVKRLWTALLAPRFGHMLATAVSYTDVQDFHQRLLATPFQANRALAVLSKMLQMAERWGHRTVGSDPTRLVSRYKEPSRRRYAKPIEIAKIGRLIAAEADENPEAAAFLLLLAYSGARPSEIVKATPDMLERVGDGGVLRILDGKTGVRDVFLPPEAMAVLDRLPRAGVATRRAGGDGPLTITGLAGVPSKVWARVRKAAGCEDLWARDWRRTFATVGFSSGVDKHIVGGLLGHADPKTTAIYAKLMEDPAHAAAAQIGSRMAGLLSGGAVALLDGAKDAEAE
jgi:integrase